MGLTCAVYKCRLKKKKGGHPVSFHKFPRAGPQREQWRVTLQRCDGWQLKNHHKICSLHFEESAIDRTGQTVRLREGAVPTIFDKELPGRLPKVVIQRQPPRKQADSAANSPTLPDQHPGMMTSSSNNSSNDDEPASAHAEASAAPRIDIPDSTHTLEPFHFLECGLEDASHHASKIKIETEPERCPSPSWKKPKSTVDVAASPSSSASRTIHPTEMPDSTQSLEPFVFLDCGPEAAHRNDGIEDEVENTTEWLLENATNVCQPSCNSLDKFKHWLNASEKQHLDDDTQVSSSDMDSISDDEPPASQICQLTEPFMSPNEVLRRKLQKTTEDLVLSRKRVKMLLQCRRRLLKKCALFQKTIKELRKQQ